MERTQRLAAIKGSFSPQISVSGVKRLRAIKQVFLPPSIRPAWQAYSSLSCDFAFLGPLKALRREKFFLNEFLHFSLFYLLTSGCAGSLLLHAGFLELRLVRATLHCYAWASYRGGIFRGRAQGLGCPGLLQHVGSVVVTQELQSTGLVIVWL